MDSKSVVSNDVNDSRRIHEKLKEQVDVIRELIHHNILTEQQYKDNKHNDIELAAIIKQNIENKYVDLDEYDNLGRRISQTHGSIGPGGTDETVKKNKRELDGLKNRRGKVLEDLKSKFETKDFLHKDKTKKPKELDEIRILRQRDRKLLRDFNNFSDQRGLFGLPTTQIAVIPRTIGDEVFPPSVSLAFEQEAEVLGFLMPKDFYGSSPSEQKGMLAKYNQERESESRNSEQMGEVLAKLDALTRIVAKEHTLEQGFNEAKDDRRQHADDRDNRFDEVDNSLKKISKQIRDYHRDMKRNAHECWPLTLWNVLPCMFKLLGMIMKLIIVAHQAFYQLVVGTTSFVKATVGSTPYVGVFVSYALNGIIMIGALMLYLGLWTILFKAGGLEGEMWDGQKIFIFVVTKVQNFIFFIIEEFWTQISGVLTGMSGFVRQAIQPTLDAIGRIFGGISTFICSLISNQPLRYVTQCDRLNATVIREALGIPGMPAMPSMPSATDIKNRFSGWGGSKKKPKKTNDNIPDAMKDEVKKVITTLSNGTFTVPALFDLATNIIGKAEKEARTNTGPYVKSFTKQLNKEGYGEGKKQIDVDEICSKMINGLTDVVDDLVENIGGIMAGLIPLSVNVGEVRGTAKSDTNNIVISDVVPYDYDEVNVLKGVTDMMMTWDTNFFNSWNEDTYLPRGFSVEDGEKLKRFVLKNNYVETPIISQRSFVVRDTPYTDYTTMTGTMVPVASSSTQKKRKKRTKGHKKRSKRKRERRRRRRRTKKRREIQQRIRKSKRR